MAWPFVEISWVDLDLIIHRQAKCFCSQGNRLSLWATVGNAGNNAVTDNCHFGRVWGGWGHWLSLATLSWFHQVGIKRCFSLKWNKWNEKQKVRISPLLGYEPCFPKLAVFWKPLCMAFKIAFKSFSESPLTVTNLIWWGQLETEKGTYHCDGSIEYTRRHLKVE